MADEFDGPDITGEPEDDAVIEEQETQDEKPTLIGGKFKSQDDLLEAYQNAERQKTQKEQEAADLRRQMEAASSTRNSATEDDKAKWAEQFFEDPLSSTDSIAERKYQAMRAQEKAAKANTRRALAELKANAMFSSVADEVEALLEEVPDYILADPEQAKHISNNAFKQALGDMALKGGFSKQKESPTERVGRNRSLGVSSADDSDFDDAEDVQITSDGMAMLRQMGAVRSKDDAAQLKKMYSDERRRR